MSDSSSSFLSLSDLTLESASSDDSSPVRSVNCESLWSNHPLTIVVLLRHFLCSECQDYFSAAWSAFSASLAPSLGVGLAMVGCGSPSLGRSLARDYGAIPKQKNSDPPTLAQQNFHLYCDQTLKIYRELGLKSKVVFRCDFCIKGPWRACVQGITKCYCFCQSGDVKQQGGIFVFRQSGDCIFKRIEDAPGDHEDPEKLINFVIEEAEKLKKSNEKSVESN